MRRSPARTLALTAVGALLLSATACGERDLAVIGATTVAEGTPTTDADAPSASPTEPAAPEPTEEPAPLDPRLNPEPSSVGTDGALQIHLPYAWEVFEGSELGAAGAGATIGGGLTVTSVPAEGRNQAEWVDALVAGTTTLFTEGQAMESLAPVVTSSGLTLFHLVQSYSDNRAHVFGAVVGDTLRLVRFGLDGSDEAVEIAAASAATLSLT